MGQKFRLKKGVGFGENARNLWVKEKILRKGTQGLGEVKKGED